MDCVSGQSFKSSSICFRGTSSHPRGSAWVLSHVRLCNPMDCSPPGSSGHEICQARILEWDAMSSSRGSSWPRDWTLVSCAPALAGGFLPLEPPIMPTCKNLLGMYLRRQKGWPHSKNISMWHNYSETRYSAEKSFYCSCRRAVPSQGMRLDFTQWT